MEKEFRKIYETVTENLIFNLHIPENNYSKIAGSFQDIEESVKAITTNRNLIRKSYFISVELIENVMRYGYFNGLYASNFLLSYADDKLYFSSGNLVKNEEIDFINQKLEEINLAFDADNAKGLLKQMYKDKLQKVAEFGENLKIGILELARRLDSKILYDFKKVSDKYSVFSIICSVDDMG
jgi:hypothetical protein